MDPKRLVGMNLKRLRLARAYSQEALALEAEVDRTYVSGLERGIRNPSVMLLDRFAQVLKVPLAEFLKPVSRTEASKPLPRGRRRAG